MARYSRIPNPHASTDEELEAAFDNSDDEADDRQDSSAPLLPTHAPPSGSSSHPLAYSSRPASPTNRIPGAYDFEYDYPPPPGSPPPPSALALPNSIGNSNGYVPASPVAGPASQPSVFRRALRTVLPRRFSEYNLVGGGQANDGVFANVTAKPAGTHPVGGEQDGIGIAPETTPDDAPPVRPYLYHGPC